MIPSYIIRFYPESLFPFADKRTKIFPLSYKNRKENLRPDDLAPRACLIGK